MTRWAKTWSNRDVKFPLPADGQSLDSRWTQWSQLAEDCPLPQVKSFIQSAKDNKLVKSCLDGVFGNSPYLSHNLLSNPDLLFNIFCDGPDHVVNACLQDLKNLSPLGHETRTDLMARMRHAKTIVATSAAIADIGLHYPVMTVTGWLSELASSTLHLSCLHLLRELHDRGKVTLQDVSNPALGSGLFVLGMGKLGAHELNFSSDVDVIIFFEGDAPCIEAGHHQRIYSQMARNLVSMMAKRTSDGYVFRVDLRLRPDPNTTPPAVSVLRAKRYYQTLAQTWERAAMIKARPVAGDLDAGERFISDNLEFVWRRNLDFPALRDIQAIKQKINAHKGSGAISVQGHNVKLGRGGIREIEFLTQTRQLIWGGQNLTIRGRGTLDMLERLAKANRISAHAATDLQKAYQFLRRVEHRIQMINDHQTHNVPSDQSGVHHLSVFLGYNSVEDFETELLSNLHLVESHYSHMFEDTPLHRQNIALDFEDKEAKNLVIDMLRELKFDDADKVYQQVQRWINGQIRATQTQLSRALLSDMIDPLLKAFAATENPNLTLERFGDLLSRLSRSINLFSAMAAEPSLLRHIAEIMGNAPKLAHWLSQQPSLIEGVLQSDFQQLDPSLDLELEPEISEMARRGLVRLFYEREFRPNQMRQDLADLIHTEGGDEPDFQSLLDSQRRWARNRKFQIGIHMLRGDMTPIQASLPLSGIAEVCMTSLMRHVQSDFSFHHGVIKGGQLAIIACGRLGSQEMTINSDLDLIFIYRHAENAKNSDGAQSLAPTKYYAKLCRRFLNGLTAPTAEGRLYEVDMRLRPSGKSGPIACSIERFENYHHHDAWTWEHQALTRARVIYQEGRLGNRLEKIISSVLTQKRDRKKLVDDIRSMRERVRLELENPQNPTIKYRQGGILDAEFIAQFLQLLHGFNHPKILQRDACTVFSETGRLGLINPDIAQELFRDLSFWRNIQGIMLLTRDNDQIDGDANSLLNRAFGLQGGDMVQSTFAEAMEETSERIARQFDRIIC